MKIIVLATLFALTSCSIKEDQAGVSITGNTGKISGVVLSSEKPTLSKRVAVIEEMVLVELQSSAKGFETESLFVNLKEAFIFDSLPPGDYQITITQEEEQLAILRDIPLEDGEAVRVTLYVGENAPESEWVPMGLGKVQFAFPALSKSTLYIHSKDFGSVAVIDVTDRDSLELDLEEGDYRAIVHSYSPMYAGISTEFLEFKVKTASLQGLVFEMLDTLGTECKIPESLLPRFMHHISVNSNVVKWEGYNWSGYEGKKTKNRHLKAYPMGSTLTYADTIGESWWERQGVVVLVDENGYGIQVQSITGQFRPIHISRLDAKGFVWDWDETKEYKSITDSVLRQMPQGSTFGSSSVNMKVVYEGDTVLRVNQEAPNTWNTINAIYTLSASPFLIPGLPSHYGLSFQYTGMDYNEDRDPWKVLSVSGDELILVDYPKTGDTLSGVMRDKSLLDDMLTITGYSCNRVYSNDKITILLSVVAPYLMSSYARE